MTPMLDGEEEKNYSVKSFRIKYTARASTPKTKAALTSPTRVTEMVRGIFNELDGGATVEHFGVCYLNSQNELIGFKAFNSGTVDQVAVYPRLIIHTALMVGAAAMILVHNHPSGYVQPSEEDKQLTRRIKDAASIFDCRILDHIIVNMEDSKRYFSFIEGGLL